MTHRSVASSVSGVWSLTWRSIVYLPLGLAIFLLLACLVLALLTLPLLAVVLLLHGLLGPAFGALTLWAVLLWAWRRFRLRSFFQAPPSFL